jgi:hypothetical protein
MGAKNEGSKHPRAQRADLFVDRTWKQKRTVEPYKSPFDPEELPEIHEPSASEDPRTGGAAHNAEHEDPRARRKLNLNRRELGLKVGKPTRSPKAGRIKSNKYIDSGHLSAHHYKEANKLRTVTASPWLCRPPQRRGLVGDWHLLLVEPEWAPAAKSNGTR